MGGGGGWVGGWVRGCGVCGVCGVCGCVVCVVCVVWVWVWRVGCVGGRRGIRVCDFQGRHHHHDPHHPHHPHHPHRQHHHHLERRSGEGGVGWGVEVCGGGEVVWVVVGGGGERVVEGGGGGRGGVGVDVCGCVCVCGWVLASRCKGAGFTVCGCCLLTRTAPNFALFVDPVPTRIVLFFSLWVSAREIALPWAVRKVTPGSPHAHLGWSTASRRPSVAFQTPSIDKSAESPLQNKVSMNVLLSRGARPRCLQCNTM